MAGEIDPITGLPKELGVFEDISKDGQTINVYVIKKKFGKKYTVIEGLDSKDIKSKDITKSLKNKFACGGTMKDGKIELQGDYKSVIKSTLVNLGFNASNILVK